MRDHGGYLVAVYLAYGVVSVGLTVWLARTLFASGAVFLEDVFADRPGMARAVNKLLVIGFYMLNLGYACLLLRAEQASDTVGAIEVLARKLGILLVSLGVLHFVNMYLFYRIRHRARLEQLPPPPPVVGGGDDWGPPTPQQPWTRPGVQG
ncbi:MAG TPA: hypothetical protein VG276_03770 [Actinomycetes bacterium]|jgi:hypothetical protein|nr:hypothetical protein [Actinomycetes bacterium]